jgi:ribosomal protein L7/L12
MYLIAFEITAAQVEKQLNTEHGWKSWNWATAVTFLRKCFATCAGMARPGLSPNVHFQILHTDVPIDQWFKDGSETTFRLMPYNETRSTFRNKVMDDWFESITDSSSYVVTLLATVSGDVGYDKIWDRLIANSAKWNGNVSVMQLFADAFDLATLDYATHRLLGSAIGDDTFRVDPGIIDQERRQALSQVEFFSRVFGELSRREEIQRQQEQAMAEEDEDSATQLFDVRLDSASSKSKVAKLISEECAISLFEALQMVSQTPAVVAESLDFAEARAFRQALVGAGAKVTLVPVEGQH